MPRPRRDPRALRGARWRPEPAVQRGSRAFLEHREDCRVILARDRRRFAVQRSHARSGSCVDHISLPAAPARQPTHPSRCRARHINHNFTANNEPLGKMPSDPTRHLERPAAFGEMELCPPKQLPLPGQRRLIRVEATGVFVVASSTTGRGVRTLVRTNPRLTFPRRRSCCASGKSHGRHAHFETRTAGPVLC